jgi:hypothetical protein
MKIIKLGNIPEIKTHTCDKCGTVFEYDERNDFTTDCCGDEILYCPSCDVEISKLKLNNYGFTQ